MECSSLVALEINNCDSLVSSGTALRLGKPANLARLRQPKSEADFRQIASVIFNVQMKTCHCLATYSTASIHVSLGGLESSTVIIISP